jgi:N-acetylneuraminic acid mutarotase
LNPPAARRRLFLKAQPESREVTMCGSGGIRPHVRRRVRAALAVLVALASPTAAQNIWTATSAAGAPTGVAAHTAVWTGSKMVVWGGSVDGGARTNTGGIYDPATDTWTATSTAGAPTARSGHTAVWTGSKMIVWGGATYQGSAGGIFDPAMDTWTPTSTAGAPTDREGHTAVWTGSRMIVWGGLSLGDFEYLNSGGIYDPATEMWMAMSTVGAPSARSRHTAVWTGSVMIVWGGNDSGGAAVSTGGIYDPATDTWTDTSAAGAPSRRASHTAVWTGSRMVVWGGWVFDPPYSSYPSFPNTGGIYDPGADTWTATSTAGAATARAWHTATWTGSKMIVWGGSVADSTLRHYFYNTGGSYDPTTDTWKPTSTIEAPTARNSFTAVWTGWRMIVWGGWVSLDAISAPDATDTGGKYDPGVDTGIVEGPPFGWFDTPVHGATEITGAIPVTGWALDDHPGTELEIYRDPMPGEPTRSNGKVYIGDATFVPGARPDVAAAYPTYPNADRAGWGYMLLTNMLPGNGNGAFTLHAYAYDDLGLATLLGSKAITCTNATATRPFGTIDTPAQGQSVSGSAYNVFGWALTPQPGTIPTDGSTLQVYVDGVPLGHPTYNLYRSDIATLFPGYANSDGAVGLFVLDTTTLSNGIHTIAWAVTDDLGRSDGIGSRYFWVQN